MSTIRPSSESKSLLERTVLAFLPGRRGTHGRENVAEHLRWHVLAKRERFLDALGPHLVGINGPRVGVDSLGEAQSELPDSVGRIVNLDIS